MKNIIKNNFNYCYLLINYFINFTVFSFIISVFYIQGSGSCLYAKEISEDLTVKDYYNLYVKCESSKNLPVEFRSDCKKLDSFISSLEKKGETLETKEKNNLESMYSSINEKLKEKNIDKKDKLYLLINKVKTLNVILLVNKNSKDESNKKYKQEMLSCFDSIIDESDSYEKEQALYLKGLFYERYDDVSKSAFYHNILVSFPFKTKYGLLSSIYLGDHFYSKKDYTKATTFYIKAKNYLDNKEYEKGLNSLDSSDKFYYESYFNINKDIVYDMELKISYRLSWTYFLNHNSLKAIEEAQSLLSKYSEDLLKLHQYKKVESDMIDIISDSLYEKSYKDQDLYFKNKNIVFKEKVSLSLAKKYKQELLYKDCIRIADNYYYPDTKEYLYLLSTKASCYKLLNQKDDKYSTTLEELAGFLDSGFWKIKFQNDPVFIEDLNTISNDSLEEVADIYYNNREKSYNYAQKSLIMYESLLSKHPGSELEVFWSIRVLYSLYSLSLYDDVIDKANTLKIKKDLTNSNYADISYVLIKAKLDKLYNINSIYRSSNNSNNNNSNKNDNNSFIKENDIYIDQLNEDITLYSKAEQNFSKIEEILLLVASSFKNLELYEKALDYYETLLSYDHTTSSSKSVAIRGVVFCGMKVMKNSELISILSNLLKTQDLNNISLGLERELLSILSASLLKEGETLYRMAEFDKGAKLLISVLSSFANIKDKDKICSLGLEMLSLSDNTSSSDLDISVCKNDKDLYVKAKFLENNLNFSEAGSTYLEFIEKNPKDPRVEKSIDRSLKMFEYENDILNTSYVLYKKALYYKGKDDIYNYKKYRLKSLVLYKENELEGKNNVLDKVILSMTKEKNLNILEKDTLLYLDSWYYLHSFNTKDHSKGVLGLEKLISSYNKLIKNNKKIEEDRLCLLDKSYNSLGSYYENTMISVSNLNKKLEYFNKSQSFYSNIKGSCKLEDVSNSYVSILRISKYMLDTLKTKNTESSFDVYKTYSNQYLQILSLVHKYYDLVNKEDENGKNKVIGFDYDMKTLNNFIHY